MHPQLAHELLVLRLLLPLEQTVQSAVEEHMCDSVSTKETDMKVQESPNLKQRKFLMSKTKTWKRNKKIQRQGRASATTISKLLQLLVLTRATLPAQIGTTATWHVEYTSTSYIVHSKENKLLPFLPLV